MDTPRPNALILGGTGRLAGLLRWAWTRQPPDLTLRWQTRRSVSNPDEIRIDSIQDAPGLARAIAQADVVLDLTGKTTGSEAELALNSTLARATLEAADGTPVLLASSAAVYGPVTHPAAEATPPAPVSAYGHAKVAVETLARDYSGAICLRIGNVAGADALLGAAPRDGILLDQWPDGTTPVRSYLGPASFAAVLATLLTRAARGTSLPRCLNVAAPGGVAMGDLLDAARIPWTPRPAGPAALPRVVFDTTLLETLHPFPGTAGTAATIAAEWRHLTEAP